jgi:tetratricopeptide (TPR) repeat protein
VHGPGGVGKSAIVDWVAYEFYRLRTFESIIHLSAKDRKLTEHGITACDRSLCSLEDLFERVLTTFQEPVPADLDEKKAKVNELLGAWSILLVLDNMETVSDNRIIDYLQRLPRDSRAKVLLTSRERTGGWEIPVSVSELNDEETCEFVTEKSIEMKIDFPHDDRTCALVRDRSGGLPLAIQWILGRYRIARNLSTVLEGVDAKDSPVLEFSFRNIWDKLSPDAKSILAVTTIFESPPTDQQLCIATDWQLERIGKALAELEEVTLLMRTNRQTDGQVVHVALPITLQFAKHQFSEMGTFETSCRRRVKQFSEQVQLRDSEVYRFSQTFEVYGLSTDSEKKAAILCRRGESELFSGNADSADLLFKQARDMAPQSAYALAKSAAYELARNRVGVALDMAKRATALCNRKTGELCYTILARVYDVQRDRYQTLEAFRTALEYAPTETVLRHQYGVALSRAGQTTEAVDQFGQIIEAEKQAVPLRETLLIALKTRIINLRRLGRDDEAEIDLEYAKRMLAENPHLQHQARHIAELE